MNKSKILYTIVLKVWAFIKPYSTEMNCSDAEIEKYTAEMNELSGALLEMCDGHPERKFARDLITACNNYYQARFAEVKNG